jgi:hypothetical protein
MKIPPVGAEVFYADGRTEGQTGRQAGRQTDMTTLTVVSRNFATTPKSAMKDSCYTLVRSTGLYGISLKLGSYCLYWKYFSNTSNVMPNITLSDFYSNSKISRKQKFDTERAAQDM